MRLLKHHFLPLIVAIGISLVLPVFASTVPQKWSAKCKVCACSGSTAKPGLVSHSWEAEPPQNVEELRSTLREDCDRQPCEGEGPCKHSLCRGGMELVSYQEPKGSPNLEKLIDAVKKDINNIEPLEDHLKKLPDEEYEEAKKKIKLSFKEDFVLTNFFKGAFTRLDRERKKEKEKEKEKPPEVRSAQILLKPEKDPLDTCKANVYSVCFDLVGGKHPVAAGEKGENQKKYTAELFNNSLYHLGGLITSMANKGKGCGHVEAITQIPEKGNVVVVDLGQIFGVSDEDKKHKALAVKQLITPLRGLMGNAEKPVPVTAEKLITFLSGEGNYQKMALLWSKDKSRHEAMSVSEFWTSIGGQDTHFVAMNDAEKTSLVFKKSQVSVGARDLYMLDIKDADNNIRGTLFWSLEFPSNSDFYVVPPDKAEVDGSARYRIPNGGGSELIFVPRIGDAGNSGGNGAPVFFAYATKGRTPYLFAKFIDARIAYNKSGVGGKNIFIPSFNKLGCIRCHANATRGETKSINLSDSSLTPKDIFVNFKKPVDEKKEDIKKEWLTHDGWVKKMKESASHQSKFVGIEPLVKQLTTWTFIEAYLDIAK